MQPGHVHTGSTQSVVLVSSKLLLATGADELLVPKMLFRFKRRICSDLAKILPRSAAISKEGELAEAGATKRPSNRSVANTVCPTTLGELCISRARIMPQERESRSWVETSFDGPAPRGLSTFADCLTQQTAASDSTAAG